MDIDDRKLRILAAIIETYIQTGEPVGSKTLAQKFGFTMSPATIRNEMAALFEMGLLEQPYTSAGRVPSHMGYRVYIDQLMQCQALTEAEKSEIEALFNLRDPDPDRLLADAAAALAKYTGCAAFSSTSTPHGVTVRKIQLIPTGTRTALLLLVASNGVIKNKVIRLDFNMTPQNAEFLDQLANGRFAGRSLEEISASYINSVAESVGEYSRIFTPVLAGIYELCRQVYDGQFYAGGQTNLLNYAEFDRVAHDLLTLVSNKRKMDAVLPHDDRPISVLIGKENPFEELAGGSVVVATYDIGPDRCGAIGLVGPVRLDYRRLIPHMEYFAKTLGRLLSETMEP